MSVREWFAGQEILLTGVTSDVGHAVLDKLLRSCPEIKKIYVVVRSKNGLTQEERVGNLLSSTGFNRVKQENSGAISRVKTLDGNLLYPDLGLRNRERALLNNVSIAIHAGGPHEGVLELACDLPALRTVAMVSKIFRLRGQISESLLNEKVPDVSLALVRIPAIGPAIQEPIPGFMNVLRAPAAIMVGASFALGNADSSAPVLPADLAANALIVCAWDKGTRSKDKTATIYNMPAIGCTWQALISAGRKASAKFPYPSFGVRGMTTRPWLRWIVILLMERLPSVLCDTLFPIVGVKSRLVEEHVRVGKILKDMEPVFAKSWNSEQNRIHELHERLTARDKVDFCLRPNIDLDTYAMCAAAAASKLSLNAKNVTIIKHVKLLFLVAIIAALFGTVFARVLSTT